MRKERERRKTNTQGWASKNSKEKRESIQKSQKLSEKFWNICFRIYFLQNKEVCYINSEK